MFELFIGAITPEENVSFEGPVERIKSAKSPTLPGASTLASRACTEGAKRGCVDCTFGCEADLGKFVGLELRPVVSLFAELCSEAEGE